MKFSTTLVAVSTLAFAAAKGKAHSHNSTAANGTVAGAGKNGTAGGSGNHTGGSHNDSGKHSSLAKGVAGGSSPYVVGVAAAAGMALLF